MICGTPHRKSNRYRVLWLWSSALRYHLRSRLSAIVIYSSITIQRVVVIESLIMIKYAITIQLIIVIERITLGSAFVIEPAILFDYGIHYLSCVCDRPGDHDRDCNRNRVCDQCPNAILIESAITIQIVILMSDGITDTCFLYNSLPISSKRFRQFSPS